MDWTLYDTQSKRWRNEGKRYIAAINAFVEKGMQDGWDSVGAEPQETREDMAQEVLKIVRQANESGEIAALREYFPPAHEPLIGLIREKGQAIRSVFYIDENRMVFTVGASWEPTTVYLFADNQFEILPNVHGVGRSPDGRIYALAYENGIYTYDGWQGSELQRFDWPTGLEGIPGEWTVESMEEARSITELIPFPDQQRLLLVNATGVYVLSTEGARRLHPDKETIQEWKEDMEEDEPFSIQIDMEHGAISRDGKWIAFGSQDSEHLVFNAELNINDVWHPESSYPHYALFSYDSRNVLFNACHFYNGVSIAVPLEQTVPAEATSKDSDEFIVDDECRIYAGVSWGDVFIVGDAYGYVRAWSITGEFRWRLFVGSTISGMDISPDGKILLVGTYGGILHRIRLDAGRDEYMIGTGEHSEERRWLIWKKEQQILAW
ncbi:hypothetical protein [Aneurinibacillus aneurinilyticus]|jgi:WD40 repeat protein|uniref:WD40 repeat domain-containing protein n=2 Tax=Aneurinibacillus aneurinilyticus TaxID=1391 RepID=A0A848D084_ANEAE|nr:hypothetical protein [Aneurinibacillus aneurinilyticus]ERI07570.1 hypothetical protein HMPREF0083_04360 [Aneurinibacillus aneurinilyticus ATCC 12856]MCI1695687.1 hypothetical protein [Aneurinibacillus aneurinilyticus]MED0707677.1 hypothetical protein [Aneurinibacillus aneurinilyticus]MED0722789.1 hypothetical protein [Aneurinibacillus aneurinilyticus]MED0734550.1 hypothetical protein [Aneurinibacillus aneurinilyticus]